MSVSLYQAFVPYAVRTLNNLAAVLTKGEQHAGEHGTDPAAMLEGKLAEDMFALPRQVQIATDGVKACATRLGGVENPSYPDTEKTFPELHERIAKTIAFIQSVPASAMEGAAERTISFKVGARELSFSGADYVFAFVLPNLYFHVTTAYLILRHQGVKVGKTDYLGG